MIPMMDAKAWSAQLANRVVDGLMKAELLARDDCERAIQVAESEVFDRLCLDGCPPGVEPGMEDERIDLAREIEQTLQGLVWVPRLNPRSPVASRDFWGRCRLLTPHWHFVEPPRIFVDGYAAQCKWNSWKVYTDAIEDGLSLWAGYASAGRWTEHAWCMLNGQFVETTWGFRAYYGAELNAAEREEFGKRLRSLNFEKAKNRFVWTMVNGERQVVRYDKSQHAASIGRQRDAKTGAIKEGLGRTDGERQTQ